MLKTERERGVIEILRETGGFVSTGLLCERLFASASSVRRDLCSLEKEGIVRRVHGGAELCSGLISFATARNSTPFQPTASARFPK